MKLEDKLRKERERIIAADGQVVPASLQGVSKARIRAVLRNLDLEHNDIVDAVFALLDDTRGSFFANAPAGSTVADGATTAHVGCHVGILQRGGTKLDREGRDYWIKPLRDLGAVEAVLLDSKSRRFLDGHPVAKSPNSAYRLNAEFKSILQAPEADWKTQLRIWAAEDRTRSRLQLQAEMAERSRKLVDTKHFDLICSCRDVYVPRFLPGYEILYVDDADGDRVTDEEQRLLSEAGLELGLDAAMPDVLAWHREQDQLWVVEAVTSDGEVDLHKRDRLREWAEAAGKKGIGFTTAYQTWRAAASRQARHKNIAPDTYVWIEEDPSKHWRASTFPHEGASRG